MEESDIENIPEEIRDLNEREMKTYLDISEMIRDRTTYGIREEKIKTDNFAILTWSNGGKRWMTTGWLHNSKEKGDVIQLDANMILVPYNAEIVDKFINHLPNLPLYNFSTEAKVRGVVKNEINATLGWVKAQLGE